MIHVCCVWRSTHSVKNGTHRCGIVVGILTTSARTVAGIPPDLESRRRRIW
jgi:hypothetical protein